MPAQLTIGRLARRTGLTPRAIRHYEQLGLLRPPGRTPSNYRVFSPEAIERLRFISNCRALGFSIPEIAELLGIMDDPNHTCAQVAALASVHLEIVDRKLKEMAAARGTLARFLEQCSAQNVPDCPMLNDLTERAASTHIPQAGVTAKSSRENVSSRSKST